MARPLEIGAAWNRQTSANRAYLSVKVDVPCFPAPLNARLIDDQNGSANHYWSRRIDE